MPMYSHPCVKCGTAYQDSDPDAYYCPRCNESRKAIAAEIDAKRPKNPTPQPMSDLQHFESVAKTLKSASGGLATFARASDIM